MGSDTGLHRLNADTLFHVLEHLQGVPGGLLRLSATCRMLREVCKPMIFRAVSRTLNAPVDVDAEDFCPSTLSPFVQSLALVDDCEDQRWGVSALFHLMGGNFDDKRFASPDSPFLCAFLNGPELLSCLNRMTSLRKLSLASSRPCVCHGVRWGTLKAILSLPQLQEFSLQGLLFSPALADDATPEELEVPALEHIRSFRYEAPSFRVSGWGTRDSYPFPSEETMLHRVLEKLHGSVEKLTLSSEPAPIRAMAQWTWPHLRELKLTGERWAEPRTPFVSLFVNMPRLQKVAFDLAVVRGHLMEAPPIWPRGHRATFPWPDLTHLSLSHPHTEDEVFAHLPPTLQSLSLSCRPHKAEKLFLDGTVSHHHRYKYPVLDSSDMLGILRRCHTLQLAHLGLEYNTGEREHDLLNHLAVAFPRLTSLQVYRYRSTTSHQAQVPALTASASARTIDDVDFQAVESFGRSLAPLAGLHTVNACLDYENTPRPRYDHPRVREFQYQTEDIDRFAPTLYRAADVLARATGPSVERIRLWRPKEPGGYEWLAFRVVRHGGSDSGVETKPEEDWRVSGS